jgi:primosomal protein N'
MVAVKDAQPTPDAALLLPRRYQEEIFRRSQEENVIAALDTGSGKTFISTLLIKWMSIQEHAQGKAILFLVPKVALVEQQGDFIATQTPLRVKKLRGSLEMDLTDRAKWREAFESADVLIMTGEAFGRSGTDLGLINTKQPKYSRIFSHTRTGVLTRSVISSKYSFSLANIRVADLLDRL